MIRIRGRTISMVAILFSGLALSTGNSIAQTAKDFAGSWTLVSITLERDGKKTDMYGANPTGSLTFDGIGRYSLMIIRAALPKVASGNREGGTAEENKAIAGGSLAHFGSYTVSPADKTFIYRIEKSTFPNWDGTEQKRVFTLTGDQLKYVAPTTSVGAGTAEVVWKRTK